MKCRYNHPRQRDEPVLDPALLLCGLWKHSVEPQLLLPLPMLEPDDPELIVIFKRKKMAARKREE
jgi:hypothetical protein